METLPAVLDKIRLNLYLAHTFPVLYMLEKLSHKLSVYMPVNLQCFL